MERFRTQLPYALFNGSIALCAFGVAGLTGSAVTVFVALIAQISGRLLIRKFRTDEAESTVTAS